MDLTDTHAATKYQTKPHLIYGGTDTDFRNGVAVTGWVWGICGGEDFEIADDYSFFFIPRSYTKHTKSGSISSEILLLNLSSFANFIQSIFDI
jgi:hypothetical protein